MKENTRQHFVPQCYLKQFMLSSDTGIYLYDKKLSKEYFGSLGKVCCIDDFYTLDEYFSNGDPCFNPKVVEKEYFANYIEAEYKDTLDEIQKFIQQWTVKNQQFPEILRSKLATFIVIQFLRLPDTRVQMKQIYDNTLYELVSFTQKMLSVETGNKAIEGLNIKATYDPNRIDYKNGYGNPELINYMAESLYNNIWVFSYSANNEFLTCDNPIIIVKHKSGVRPINLGLAQEGAEIIFSISPNLSVIIYDRRDQTDLAKLDSNVIPANVKMKFHINSNIYLYAHRYVFSYNKDFSIVKQWLDYLNGKHEVRTNFSK